MKIIQILMNEIYWTVRILSTPDCWVRNNFTNKEWDMKVLNELKNPIFSNKTEFEVALNGKVIWIENKHYACVCERSTGPIPSRRTVFKFFDALEEYEND